MSTAADEEKTGGKKSTLPVWVGAGVAAAVALIIVIVLVLVMALTSLMSAYDDDQRQKTAAMGCDPAGTTSDGVTNANQAAPQDMRKEQIKIAKEIDQTTQELGLSGKASEISIITAYGESTLQNLDYGDQRNGVTNPDGSPATSYGAFQQQTSQGWGTKEEVMNVAHATKSFLLGPKHDGSSGLLTVPGWDTGEISNVIHTVQGNSDAGYYVNSYAPARDIMKEAGIDTSRAADPEKMKKAGVNTKDGADKGKGDKGSSTVNDDCSTSAKDWNGDLGKGEWTVPLPNSHKTSAGSFGPRNIPGYPAWANLHDGVDLATSDSLYGLGGPVVAPTDLEVIGLYEPDGCVQTRVTSKDSPKFGMAFCHLGKIDVKTGDKLERGKIIGTEGNKGESLGNPLGGHGFISHLHLKLYKPDIPVEKMADVGNKDVIDPEPVFKQKGAWPETK